uniref:Abnormal cell migration protein 18-like fibronectin type I domain-containing protein n=1 Tax=Romanomermis culicivorax TaxID=13658 RepID=A0A915HV26_ROMCU
VGCTVNNGTSVKNGVILTTSQWYFTCINSIWMMTGCVVNGQLVPENKTFQMVDQQQRAFWGVCRQLGDDPRPPRMLYQDLKGCLDVNGNPVNPGDMFLFTQYLWAKCAMKKGSTVIPGFGAVPINEVSWTLEGCNNGTGVVVPDGQEFIFLQDVFQIVGARLICNLKAPGVTPRSCVVGVYKNDKWDVRILPDKCYVKRDASVGYCRLINNENDGTVFWRLNFAPNNDQNIKALTDRSYSECSLPDEQLTNMANGNMGKILASDPTMSQKTKNGTKKSTKLLSNNVIIQNNSS